jgi:Right handed beta helix region
VGRLRDYAKIIHACRAPRFGCEVIFALFLALAGCGRGPQYRVIPLPEGIMDIHEPLFIDANTEVRGSPRGSRIRMADGFAGRAAIVIRGNGVRLRNFTILGNRDQLAARSGLPPYDRSFANFTRSNGILADSRAGIDIENLRFQEMAGFAILVSRSHNVSIRYVTVESSGSRNEVGSNNATGGILLEEGTADFLVANCDFRKIRGNALWTHSLYTSPRNADGVFARNLFDTVGRDAIQVGHATGMRVEDNQAARIGFPLDTVDVPDRAIPVGLDTAGDVDHALYLNNRFSEIDGKCMDLDGLHDSDVRGNLCVNRAAPATYPLGNYSIVMNNTNPDMSTQNIRIVDNTLDSPVFGGIFAIGTGNYIARNLLRNVNTAHCNDNIAHYGCKYAAADPEILESGIYLGRGAERPAPAHGNVVEDNSVTGWKMRDHCVEAAPDLPQGWNIVRNNWCHE